MLTLLLNGVIEVIGGLIVAALVTLGVWNLFKLVRWPELGPWLLIGLLLAIPETRRDHFVQTVLLFMAFAAVVLIGEGHEWRERNRVHRPVRKQAEPDKSGRRLSA
ncbi:hypothetical protein [Sphingomonas sp. PR090111-T3T-6A]|uniref:hypothetical protein n=1 Tax=Sphingomonas sp. PR090111-T3T-6A TaxID=685778 RepID=UPI0003679F46|nr:hypothetical protein [Sphingomonas sp. PR090111-T3T-6A]